VFFWLVLIREIRVRAAPPTREQTAGIEWIRAMQFFMAFNRSIIPA
jgi:hypothetical protein